MTKQLNYVSCPCKNKGNSQVYSETCVQLALATYSTQVVICVPLIVLVISKTVRKSKYTISKTRIWPQSWICLEIQDLDLHIVEICSKIIDLDLQIFKDYFKNNRF